MQNIGSWDYIVIGAGSAGCVVASRLSENPDCHVLLVDAGGDPNNFWIKTPAGMANMFYSDEFNWKYYTEPVQGLQNRKIYWPRGKTLGGSSAINGMVYTRGNKKDYDRWAAQGNPGWGWSDVAPFFEKAENYNNKDVGSLYISDPVINHPAVNDFIELSKYTGIRHINDLSTAGEEGTGILKATIKNGHRASTFKTYIEPFIHRKNLTILKNTHTNNVIIENKKATGVHFIKNGERLQASCNKEIIISAGVIGSPQILSLSGIGAQENLEKIGITTIIDLPAVGKNLQDHCSIQIKALTSQDNSYNKNLIGVNKYIEGTKYLLGMNSYLSLASSQAASFIRSSDQMDYADLEISFRPMTFSFNAEGLPEVDPYPAVGAAIYRVRPDSRGHIEMISSDPLSKPKIHPRYIDDERDLLSMIEGIKWVQKIFSKNNKKYQTNEINKIINNEEKIADYIRSNAKCAYHPVGTCKMGNDKNSVVDHELKVIGIENLRVIDASIMPTIVSANTNAATVMIAEKGAFMIKNS